MCPIKSTKDIDDGRKERGVSEEAQDQAEPCEPY